MKNYNIVLLRGILALVVFFSHVAGALNLKQTVVLRLTPMLLIIDGALAVSIFFILSGYFLSKGYENKVSSVKTFAGFIIHRLLRLYIMAWTSILFAICLKQIEPYGKNGLSDWINTFWNEHITFEGILGNMVMLRYHGSMLNPPLWTVSKELTLAIIFPFFLSLMRWIKGRGEKRGHLVICLVLVFLFWFGAKQTDKLSYLYWFVIGYTFSAFEETICRKGRLSASRKRKLSALVILGLIIWFLGDIIGYTRREAKLYLASILQLFGAAAIVQRFFLVRNNASDNFFIRLLEYIGINSYVFYLFHFPIMLFFRFLCFRSTVGYYLLYTLVCLGATLLIASVMGKLERYINVKIKALSALV